MFNKTSYFLHVRIILILTILMTYSNVLSQNSEWIDLSAELPESSWITNMTFDSEGDLWFCYPLTQYNGENWIVHSDTTLGHELNNISSLVIDSQDNIWIGCAEDDGLVRYDGETWTYFDLRDWGLPNNIVNALCVDQNDAIWIGTYTALVRFYNGTWSVFDASNSPLSETESIRNIAIDSDNVKWMGMGGWGDAKIISYDDSTWTEYNEENTGVNLGDIRSLLIDSSGNKWFTCGGGSLHKLDGYDCACYTDENSGLPNIGLVCLTTDSENGIWIGTGDREGIMGSIWGAGMVGYDGLNWTVFDSTNSELPYNYVSAIIADENDNIWIATRDEGPFGGGPAALTIFDPDGFVDIRNFHRPFPTKFTLDQNYPNPFNPITNINYSLPEQSVVKLTVYDIRGNEVIKLQNAYKAAGNYELQWNGLDQSGNPVNTGVYFCRLQADEHSKTIKMVYLR